MIYANVNVTLRYNSGMEVWLGGFDIPLEDLLYFAKAKQIKKLSNGSHKLELRESSPECAQFQGRMRQA